MIKFLLLTSLLVNCSKTKTKTKLNQCYTRNNKGIGQVTWEGSYGVVLTFNDHSVYRGYTVFQRDYVAIDCLVRNLKDVPESASKIEVK